MNNKQIYGLIAVLLAWFWAIVFWAVWVFAKPDPVRYDCGISEISPDVPLKAKQQCRRLRQPA